MTGRPFLVAGIAFSGALLGSMSGGSSSALTMSAWLAMGIPVPTAIATDKVGGVLWTMLGSRNYLRGRVVDWRLLFGMMAAGLVAAWFGAALTVRIDPEVLKRAIGGLVLVLIVVMLASPRLGATPQPPRLSRPAMAAAALPIGFYDGFLGSGNTILATLLFCWGRGLELLSALGHFYFLACGWSLLGAYAFISRGYYDVALMIPATLGAATGGYVGSKVGALKGTAFVRVLFVVVGSTLGLKLLLGL